MAKKLHMESSAAQSDPTTNAHARTGSAHPSVSSGSSTVQNHRSVTSKSRSVTPSLATHCRSCAEDATAVARDSIDYIPPDLSLDDQPDSEVPAALAFSSSSDTLRSISRMNATATPVTTRRTSRSTWSSQIISIATTTTTARHPLPNSDYTDATRRII